MIHPSRRTFLIVLNKGETGLKDDDMIEYECR
jgi:hypothetical protein